MESRTFNTSVWNVFVVQSILCCASLLFMTVPGVGALKFLKNPPKFFTSDVGMNLDFNCTTDDPNATVSLLYSSNFATWTEKHVTPNKLALRGQVFTLLNLVLLDGGQYRCKATDQSGQTIQSSIAFLYVNSAVLPNHFELIPEKAIYVLQGQDGTVTCESKGNQIATLKWEKRMDDRSYVAVPNSWVTNIKDLSTNRVKAVLKIANAQLGDSGVYQCTVSVKPDKSDFKLTSIQVNAPAPPSIKRYGGENVITEGSTKIVKCIAKGSPKPNVTWYRNNKQLSTKKSVKDPRSCKDFAYEVYEEGNDSSGVHTPYTIQVLKIRSVLDARHHEEFKCVASNGILPDAELIVNFHVPVELANHLKLRPANPIVVLQGQEAKVKCDSVGISAAKVQWKKRTNAGDVAVPESTVTIVKDKSTNRTRAILKVKFAQKQDSGVYKCVLTAFGKTDFKLTTITVKESLAFSRNRHVLFKVTWARV